MSRTMTCAGLVLAAAAVALSGCSSSGGTERSADDASRTTTASADAGSSTEPSAREQVSAAVAGRVSSQTRIPRELRRRIETPVGDSSAVPGSVFIPDDDGDHVVQVTRLLPGCDGGVRVQVPVDRDVRDFAWGGEQHGDYVVARQLTVYPTVEAAASFVTQVNRRPADCPSGEIGGRPIDVYTNADFVEESFGGMPNQHDDTWFGQGHMTTESQRSVYVDAVTRGGNVVVLTRVANLDYDGSADIMFEQQANAEFVDVVRAESGESADLLDAFE